MPTPDASQATPKTFPKSGNLSTGASVNLALIYWKALVAAAVHQNFPFFKQFVMGAMTVLKPLRKRR